jgi:hypothetical protein
MNPLLDRLNDLLDELEDLIAANPPQPGLDQLRALAGVVRSERDKALLNLYNQADPAAQAAIASLQTATQTVNGAVQNMANVTNAINDATRAAKLADQILGFLLHAG